MESFEQNSFENLSEAQREQLDGFFDIVQPLIVQLVETNDSQFSDQILEETKRFKESLHEQGLDIPDGQIDAFVRSLFDFREEKAA